MSQEIPDYEVGLSEGIRNRDNSKYICAIIRRLHSGDPGDIEDPEQLMDAISAHLEERPSAYYFNGESPEENRIVALFQPQFFKILFFYEEEMGTPAVTTAIRHFGFDEHLQPILF